MTLENTETTDTRMPNNFDKTLNDIVELGQLWARYGLKVGQAALEATSKTLQTTAENLERIADAVAGEDPAPGSK